VLVKENLRGKGPTYVFSDVAVEMETTAAATIADALAQADQA